MLDIKYLDIRHANTYIMQFFTAVLSRVISKLSLSIKRPKPCIRVRVRIRHGRVRVRVHEGVRVCEGVSAS